MLDAKIYMTQAKKPSLPALAEAGSEIAQFYLIGKKC